MVVRHPKLDILETTANHIVDDLKIHFQGEDIEILGPYENGIKKSRDIYRLSIMIRGSNVTTIKKYIYNSWIFTQEGLLIDVDPI